MAFRFLNENQSTKNDMRTVEIEKQRTEIELQRDVTED